MPQWHPSSLQEEGRSPTQHPVSEKSLCSSHETLDTTWRGLPCLRSSFLKKTSSFVGLHGGVSPCDLSSASESVLRAYKLPRNVYVYQSLNDKNQRLIRPLSTELVTRFNPLELEYHIRLANCPTCKTLALLVITHIDIIRGSAFGIQFVCKDLQPDPRNRIMTWKAGSLSLAPHLSSTTGRFVA